MPAPYEIIVGPATVYSAPVGEAFPAVDEVPSGGWDIVGTLGSENYGESGVLVRSPRTTNPIRVLGSTTPRKHVVTESGFQVEFDVIDASAEVLALGYGVDPDSIVDTPAGSGTPGTRAFDIPTSPIPYQRAILVRVDQSAYGDGLAMQFEIYAANQIGTGEGGFTKGDAFMLRHVWDAVKTEDGFVGVVIQDAPAS